MMRASLALAGAVLAMLAASASSSAAAGPTAKVQSTATVTGAFNVVFEIDLSNCPAGQPIALLSWEATEPNKPDAVATSVLTPFGDSNGAAVQHLVFETSSVAFLAGEKWVGDGSVSCGTTTISVSGMGQTKSPNGV